MNVLITKTVNADIGSGGLNSIYGSELEGYNPWTFGLAASNNPVNNYFLGNYNNITNPDYFLNTWPNTQSSIFPSQVLANAPYGICLWSQERRSFIPFGVVSSRITIGYRTRITPPTIDQYFDFSNSGMVLQQPLDGRDILQPAFSSDAFLSNFIKPHLTGVRTTAGLPAIARLMNGSDVNYICTPATSPLGDLTMSTECSLATSTLGTTPFLNFSAGIQFGYAYSNGVFKDCFPDGFTSLVFNLNYTCITQTIVSIPSFLLNSNTDAVNDLYLVIDANAVGSRGFNGESFSPNFKVSQNVHRGYSGSYRSIIIQPVSFLVNSPLVAVGGSNPTAQQGTVVKFGGGNPQAITDNCSVSITASPNKLSFF